MSSSSNVSLAAQDHDVLFYERDADLVATVSNFLSGAVRAGDVAMLVAAPEHRDAIEHAMASHGLDLAEAKRGGQFVVLDAADALARFHTGEQPDPAAFDAVIGELVRSALASGRAVRAYGEMVALLWGAGEVMAAIELERLWNELRQRHPFALLCGYPAHALVADELTQSVLEVCHLHSDVAEFAPVADAPRVHARAERHFASTAQAPRAARQFVQGVLKDSGHSEFTPAAALTVTELVSNAVLHAESDVTVRVTSVGGALRIAVRDTSTSLPAPRASSPDDASGRGLALVAALASKWGTELSASGKTVWVEFAGTPAPALPG